MVLQPDGTFGRNDDGPARGAPGTPNRYARTVPSFGVGDERYAWLERSVFVGTLDRRSDGVPGVHLRFYEVA